MSAFDWGLALRIAAAAILVAHGIAHLVGFVGAWRLNAKVPYTTTVFAGRLDVGTTGIRVLGVLWLLLALDFLFTAAVALMGLPWWPRAALVAATGSLIMCVTAWPNGVIGLVIDAAIILAVIVWRLGVLGGPGLIRVALFS